MPPIPRSPLALAFASLLLLAACGGGGGDAPGGSTPPESSVGPIHNDGLRITLLTLPETLTLAANSGAELALVPADGRPGRLTFGVTTPERGGVNLVDAINAHKAEVEALGGEYRGQIELGSPLGTAYASRGRYHEGEQEVEDFRVFAVHPSGTELLTLRYTYPVPDNTEERRNELLVVLGEIEPATPPEGAVAP